MSPMELETQLRIYIFPREENLYLFEILVSVLPSARYSLSIYTKFDNNRSISFGDYLSNKNRQTKKLVESCSDRTSLATKVQWKISSIFELSFSFTQFCDDFINIFATTRISTGITVFYSQNFLRKCSEPFPI